MIEFRKGGRNIKKDKSEKVDSRISYNTCKIIREWKTNRRTKITEIRERGGGKRVENL